MSHTVSKYVKLLVLEGDGIGPEICTATTTILKDVGRQLGISFSFEYRLIGLKALQQSGSTFSEDIVEAAKRADGVLLGPVSHNEYPPANKGGRNPSGELRKNLDLFANIRPALSHEGLPPRCGKPIDLVIVRENTEGFYSDRSMFAGPGEIMPTPDLALSFRKVTRASSLRIARSAFELARRRRRRVTAVHKANVLRMSDGLFLTCVREVAEKYPDVEYEEKIIDAMAALLVRDSSKFDVIVTTNMFGDILSDQASEISGSLGLAASLNAGQDYAVAQAQHGSAPDIAGKDLANPCSLIGSAAMLLDWLGERHNRPDLRQAARMIESAISRSVRRPDTRTRDLGGILGTSAYTSVLQHIIAGSRAESPLAT